MENCVKLEPICLQRIGGIEKVCTDNNSQTEISVPCFWVFVFKILESLAQLFRCFG